MLQKFYTVYDRHVGYGFPFAQPNNMAALRTFKIWLNDPNCEIGKCPEDYELFYLGEYDTEKGTCSFAPEAIMRGGASNAPEI